MARVLFLLFCLTHFQPFVFCVTINDTETLLTNLLANYNRNVRPIYDQDSAITMNIILYIKSIQEFDEVQEKFTFVGALGAEWNDYKIQWDPNMYGGLMNTTLSYDKIWVPELVLSSPSGKGSSIGKTTDIIRVHSDGKMEWLPSDLIQSTCSVNARYYPFDVQKCTTSFVSLGYKNYEVVLNNTKKTIDFSLYSENSLWKVENSETKTVVITSGGESEIHFTIILSRKSAFVVINLLMPILVLSLLNAWVFVLVPESGERIGYSITTLLAIAVYMTIVSDTLPQTSEPVPLISYKLMADMMTSALTVFVTILNLRLHSREDDEVVPRWLKRLYNTLRCACCTTDRIAPEKESMQIVTGNKLMTSDTKKEEIKQSISDITCNEVGGGHTNDLVSWKSISYMIDWIALIGFTVFSLLSFIIFVGITAPTQ